MGSNVHLLPDQILENKQKFIGQIMTSKSPARACEDTDEVSLKYAEVKALASGNPLIMEKTELDMQVSKLQLMKASHTSRHYQLEDMLLKTYPKQIAQAAALIAGLEQDQATAAAKLPADKEHFQMTIAGKEYADRKEAGAAILAACAGLHASHADGVIGSYAGFSMQLQFNSFTQNFSLILKGDISHSVELGEDAFGNITRINHTLENIGRKLEGARQQLQTLQSQVEEAKEELRRPFPQEEELASKQARLNEVNAMLDMDTKGEEVLPEGAAPEKEPAADAVRKPSVLAKLRTARAAVSAPKATPHRTEPSL